jgi:hypothetical protein
MSYGGIRKKSMLLSCVIEIIGIGFFVVLNWIENIYIFIILATIGRILFGIVGFLFTFTNIFYCFLVNFFKEMEVLLTFILI